MIICRIGHSTGCRGLCEQSRASQVALPVNGVCLHGGEWWWRGGGAEEKGLGKGNERKMCVSAELLKPSQALSWAMGQHDLSMPLSWYWRIFAEERLNCQVNFAIAGDEVKQSLIMLGCSANCPTEIPPAVQDYSGVIWPKAQWWVEEISRVKKDTASLSCPQKSWNCLRWERGWELLMVCFYALTGDRLPSTHHCNLISYSKKWTFLFPSMWIYHSKVHSWCGMLWCFCLGPQYLPDIFQSPLFYFPFCLLGSFLASHWSLDWVTRTEFLVLGIIKNILCNTGFTEQLQSNLSRN